MLSATEKLSGSFVLCKPLSKRDVRMAHPSLKLILDLLSDIEYIAVEIFVLMV